MQMHLLLILHSKLIITFRIDNRSMITGTKTILFILDSQTLHYVKAYSILNTVNVFCLNWSFEAEKIKFLIQGPNRVYFVTIDSDMTYTLQAGLFRTDNNTEAFFVQDLILKNSSQVNLKYIYAHFLFQLAYNVNKNNTYRDSAYTII